MSINEKISDEFIAHSLFTSRYATFLAHSVIKELDTFDTKLFTHLILAINDIDRQQLTERGLRALLSDVITINSEANGKAINILLTELERFAHFESWALEQFFADVLPKSIRIKKIKGSVIYNSAVKNPFCGRLLSEWAGNIKTDRLTRISNVVRRGVMDGETTDQIVRKIRGTRASKYKDGIIEESRRNIRSVVRTATAHLSAIAGDEFAIANQHFIKAKQWRSTLDSRTTPQCMIRDGLLYSLDSKPINHKIPYLDGPGRLHFCCRSVAVLVTKSFREMGIDIDEISLGTRASMDGQVPAAVNYKQWIMSQSFKRQVAVLGYKRAQLLQDGADIGDFFTDKGEWLTLEQLADIYGYVVE